MIMMGTYSLADLPIWLAGALMAGLAVGGTCVVELGALVLLAIVALSNPFRGDFRVSPEPFERVLAQMKAG